MDYVPIDEELTIGAEASATHTLAGDRVCVTVQAIADNIRETKEVFRIIINPLGPRVRLLDGIVSVFIEDRDLDDIGQGMIITLYNLLHPMYACTTRERYILSSTITLL